MTNLIFARHQAKVHDLQILQSWLSPDPESREKTKSFSLCSNPLRNHNLIPAISFIEHINL